MRVSFQIEVLEDPSDGLGLMVFLERSLTATPRPGDVILVRAPGREVVWSLPVEEVAWDPDNLSRELSVVVTLKAVHGREGIAQALSLRGGAWRVKDYTHPPRFIPDQPGPAAPDD